MSLLRRIAIPLAVIAAVIATGANAQEHKWISGTLGPETSVSGQAAILFGDLVRERTNGRIDITNYPSAQLGTGQEQIESIATGTQQFFLSSGSAASSLVKEYGVVDVAFLFKDFDHFNRFMDSDMGQSLNTRLVDEFGVRVVTSNWFALPRYLMHTNKFILSTDDVAGVRTRSPNLPMFLRNYQNMGAVPVKVAYGEQYLALRQGLVDMTESAADRILKVRLHEVAPYITIADMMYPQSNVYISDAAWMELSTADQDIITQAAIEAGDWNTQQAIDGFAMDRKTIEEQGGKFEQMPEETRAAFAEMVRANVPQMVKDGLIPEGWFEKIMALRD